MHNNKMVTTVVLALISFFVNVFATLDTCPITKNQNFYPICKNYLDRTFDFVIIGGGTAGCVLANRLTENAGIQVLLLESGDVPSRLSEVPLNFIFLENTAEDWSFRAEQPDFFKAQANRHNPWPQGHALGGSSTINAMIYAPGVPYDYNYWGELTNDTIWAWPNMQSKLNKLRQYVRTIPYTAATVLGRFMIAIAAALRNIPVNPPPDQWYGYRDHTLTIDEHTRFSMAEAYLKPIMDRPNLCVVVNRRVNKIVIKNGNATGVEVYDPDDPSGVRVINPTKEVILTAGAINSPKILLLSGIGPTAQLSSFGLPTYANLPVGQNLEDHLCLPIFLPILDQVLPPYAATYTTYCATGQLLDNIELANFLAFFNTKGQTNRPDIEFIHFEFLVKDTTFLEAYYRAFGITEEFASQLRNANQLQALLLFLPVLLHPVSRGELLLQSLDPAMPPKLFPHYLEQGDDANVLISAINQSLIPLVNTFPFLGTDLFHFDIPECDIYTFKSDGYWRCYFKYFAGTIFHPAGTCRMGYDPSQSVVDSRLRVYGIGGLRVADSSTIPALISGHTNIATCALAENAAEIIKQDNGIS